MGCQSDRSSDKMPACAVAKPILRLLICSVAVFVVTAVLNTVSLRDRPLFPLLIFLFLVSIVSSLWGFRYALFVSLLAALGFSWLRPPVGRFWLSDWRDIFALTAFLVIGITTSYLSDRARREALNAKQAEDAARQSEEGLREVIEDRKRAEEALRNSEERWRSVFENSAIGVALTDLNGRFLATNHVFQAMVGYTEEELRALTFLDLTHEDYLQANWSLITELVEEKRRQFQIEKKYRRKDGSSIWVSNNVSLVPGTERIPRFIMALSEDITERKRAEAKLRSSEESLLEAQRLSHIGSWKLDVASGAVIVSPEIHRIFGVDPDEDTSRPEFWFSRNHPEDQKRIREFFEKSTIQKTDYDADYRIVLPDGTIKHLHAAGHPVLNESGDLMEFVGTTMDVTEQVQTRAALENALQEIKQRNEALRAREHNLDLIINTIPALVWSARPDGSAEFFNQHYLDYVGLSAEEVKDWGWTVALHPDDLNGLAGAWQSIMASGKHGEAEARLCRFDGEYRWFLFRANPLRDDSGNIVKWFGINTDIEDRKRAEEKLRRSEAYLAEAQRITHTGSWAWNVRTDALFWSQEIFRIYDYDPEMTPTWDVLLKKVHPVDRLEVERRREMEATQKEWADSEIEFRIVLPDGTVKQLHSIAHPVMDELGEIIEVVGTVRDVTERKQAEEERERLRQLEADLAHTNRLTMLGGLASSLAHELNQPITAAITSANACLRWLAHNPPDRERARAAATRIENDGSRAAEIIHRLRAFYKTGAPPKLELVDVNQVAGEMLALLRNEADRRSISLRTELALQLPQIMADRVQLQQVLMNLLLNGIEAITDGYGEVTIRSQRPEQGLLTISVADTGVGLPSEKPDRLFSAFYTTKPQGTGMGLAISRSIIEAHGGRLWATVNAERGATFHFTLPAELQQ